MDPQSKPSFEKVHFFLVNLRCRNAFRADYAICTDGTPRTPDNENVYTVSLQRSPSTNE